MADSQITTSDLRSGIYAIRCIPTGKVYVGSAVSVQNRWYGHNARLRSGIHPNRHLQNAWNKHGEIAFSWEILEAVEDDRLIEREQHFIDSLRASDRRYGFNLRVIAKSNKGIKFSDESKKKQSLARKGKPRSEEAKAKLKEAWSNMAPELRAQRSRKISEKLKGRCTCSPETIKRTAEKLRGRKLSPERRAKLLEFAQNPSPETRAKISASSRARSYSEEARANMSRAQKAKILSPEAKASIAEAARDPVRRAKLREANLGRKMTAEARAKMSEKAKNRSPEQRARISERQKGRVCSAETRTKRAASMLGKRHTAESRAKMSEVQKARVLSPEAKANIAASAKDPVRRAKLREANLGKKHTAEARAKMSEKSRNRTPEQRARMSEAQKGKVHSPETRAKMSIAQRRRYSTGQLELPFDN